MLTLPKWMYIDGITYHYKEWKGDDNSDELSDWYFCGLFSNNGKGTPPNVKFSNGSSAYLCSAATSIEKAREDLLEMINFMQY